jgi:hypothetical protein
MPERVQLVCDDVLQWAKTYTGPPFYAMLTDPPYELGFMGRDWDKTGIAFRPETWAALARHLLPGAFVMAFASSRGWHRLACAMEDAGLILHPSIFGWGFGSGFPKAARIDTVVDREAGVEREVLGTAADFALDGCSRNALRHQESNWANGFSKAIGHGWDRSITAPATPLAQVWAGHRYGLQALKPALEPIIVAQVPYRGRPVDSITQTGAGALWIEGGRIAACVDDENMRTHPAQNGTSGNYSGARDARPPRPHSTPPGRWPANFVLCHTPHCQPLGEKRMQGTNVPGPGARSIGYAALHGGRAGIQSYASSDGTETVQAWACAEGCPVRVLNEQAGERKSGGGALGQGWSSNGSHEGWKRKAHEHYTDRGSTLASTGPASRFFFTADWSLDVAEQLVHADPLRYQAKASRAERDAGMTRRNTNPCIKPLALLKWLATLLLPPAAYAPRRLLVPFAGSGSECIGGLLAGWEEVVGIEQESVYVESACQRMAWWTGYAPECASTTPERSVGATQQLSLF